MELKFQKRGCPQSNNTTADWYQGGPPREQFLVWMTRIEILQSTTAYERIKTHQSTPTKVLFILLCNQSTPSPDEDQQYSGRNVAIHIQVTQSWDKRLTQLSFQTTMTNTFHNMINCCWGNLKRLVVKILSLQVWGAQSCTQQNCTQCEVPYNDTNIMIPSSLSSMFISWLLIGAIVPYNSQTDFTIQDFSDNSGIFLLQVSANPPFDFSQYYYLTTTSLSGRRVPETSTSFLFWQPASRWSLLPLLANPGNLAMSPQAVRKTGTHNTVENSWNGERGAVKGLLWNANTFKKCPLFPLQSTLQSAST